MEKNSSIPENFVELFVFHVDALKSSLLGYFLIIKQFLDIHVKCAPIGSKASSVIRMHKLDLCRNYSRAAFDQ